MARKALCGAHVRPKLWFMAANLLYRLGEINFGSIAGGKILGLDDHIATTAGHKRRNMEATL
jgi:hypothetical protein